jgi:hypothetical protein
MVDTSGYTCGAVNMNLGQFAARLPFRTINIQLRFISPGTGGAKNEFVYTALSKHVPGK